MASKILQGDPRRPGDLHPFVRNQVNPDDAPSDWYAFLSLVLGLLAFITKWKEMASVSLILCICLFVNLKPQDMISSQVAMSFFFSISALVSTTIGRVRPSMSMPASAQAAGPAS